MRKRHSSSRADLSSEQIKLGTPILRIAIVVHGRFDAFDLARGLQEAGAEVMLLTNYPTRVVRKFGVSGIRVKSAWWHGLLQRVLFWISPTIFEPIVLPLFARWACHVINNEQENDVVYCFSGVAEEVFRGLNQPKCMKVLVRGSSEIRFQRAILEEERRRAEAILGRNLVTDLPSAWSIAREEREYALADRIFVLSTFAKASFAASMVLPKVMVLTLGSDPKLFTVTRTAIDERRRRILSGQRLRVLTVGSFSLRKGAIDFLEVASQLKDRMNFVMVGKIGSDATAFAEKADGCIIFKQRVPHQELPRTYAAADLFLFPTIEDGFAVVLAQAQASALPTLTTTNSCGPDLIVEGQTGWVVPIRSPDKIVKRLLWCDTHRDTLARMVQAIYEKPSIRTWGDAGRDFLALIAEERAGAGLNLHPGQGFD